MPAPCLARTSLLLLLAFAANPLVQATETAGISQLKQLDFEQLLDIEVVSVTRRREPLLSVPSAVQVITNAQIRRSGATTLPEALRLAENLQVAQRGANGWAISARGFNTDLGNKLLVMIDGRTVYTPLYSGVFWEAQDYLLEDIDRIEIVSGPGGTLWGANAVNGVINIITRRTELTQGLHAEAAAGPDLEAAAGLRYGGALGPQVHYRVYGKYLQHDDSPLADGSELRDSWHRRQAGFRLDTSEDARDVWRLQGDYYSYHERVPDGGVSLMRGANLLGRWIRNLGEDSTMNLRVYYDWTSLDLPTGPLTIGTLQLAPPGLMRDDLQTADVDFFHRLPLGPGHVLSWGVGFRHTHDVVASAPALAFLPAVLDQQLYNAFVQDEIRLRGDLSLTLGSKLEHNGYTGFEFEPSARLQWQAAPSQTLWAAVSRAVRVPSRIDRDLYQGAPPWFTLLKGNPQFKSEKLLAYELGYRARLSNRATMALSGFYNEYSDVRSTTITLPTLLPFYFENGVEGDTWGLEFTAAAQITDDWSLRAGYNLLQQDLRVKDGYIDIANGRNEVSDPHNQATLRSSLDLAASLQLDVSLRWVDTLRNSNGPETGNVPAYTELDARLAWQASRQLELSVIGRNLLHNRHAEYGFPSSMRTQVERSVIGKVTWRQ